MTVRCEIFTQADKVFHRCVLMWRQSGAKTGRGVQVWEEAINKHESKQSAPKGNSHSPLDRSRNHDVTEYHKFLHFRFRG